MAVEIGNSRALGSLIPERMPSSASSLEVMEAASEAPLQTKKVPSEYILRKYLLMLATLVATVTYGVGFSPPGGVWQDSVDAAVGSHLAGEPIIQTTNKIRYLVFFYCNALALASSVLVIVLFLLLSIDLLEKEVVWVRIMPLRVLMVLDLLSFMGAYATGSFRDMLTTVYTSVLMAAGVFIYLTVQVVLAWGSRTPEFPLPAEQDNITVQMRQLEERLRKMMMLLATFALSITYVSGLNSPGGFWDNTRNGHHPGDAVLSEGHHKVRLATFFVCNTTAFMASLLIIMLLLGRKLHERTTVRSHEMFGCIMAVLVGLIGAYAAGSCRETGTTAYICGPYGCCRSGMHPTPSCKIFLPKGQTTFSRDWHVLSAPQIAREDRNVQIQRSSASSLLLLLATFATAITYPAGLDPPGGVWQENGNDHLAGDPILLTTNAIRYWIFFYFSSVAFVSSLVTIILFVLRGYVLRLRAVKKVMMLQLFGLSGAYAAGVCSDINTLIYVMALASAVLVYLVIHVIFLTSYDLYVEGENLRKKRKLLYLLVTLSTAMSYQAGFNPPGGFWLQSDDRHKAGNPVLVYNHPSRYNVFFYSNSLSFVASVATMILLAKPDLYRPAIQSYALTFCTVLGLSCLMGAYAAGSTQHLTTSIGIFLLLAVAFLILVVLVLKFFVRTVTFMMADEEEPRISEEEAEIRKLYTKRKHLMLLGILVAGVTYQSGLDPPGGIWQSDTAGHDAGGPAMQDNMKQRYFAFFYSNSASFAASIIMLLLLLLQQQQGRRLKRLERPLHLKVMHSVVMLNLLALLVAYASGSSRDWKSTCLLPH